MSRNINVNPGHYKLAGRERQGEDVIQNVERQAFAQQKAEADRWREREAPPPWETTPPAPPVTQEQRDEAMAIAEVQGKKPRKTTRRAAPKRTVAKRKGPKRTLRSAAAKRPSPSRRRAKAPTRRRTR
jgi:hypothetical protein